MMRLNFGAREFVYFWLRSFIVCVDLASGFVRDLVFGSTGEDGSGNGDDESALVVS